MLLNAIFFNSTDRTVEDTVFIHSTILHVKSAKTYSLKSAAETIVQILNKTLSH